MKRLPLILLFALTSPVLFSQSLPLLWESRYAGAGDNSDKFNKIIAVPGGNYVAVGYTTRNGKYKDYLVAKIDGTTLDTMWVRTKGTGSGDDEAISCAADAAGNIYVTGYRDGGTTQDDIYTIKYDPSGVDLWDTAYNDVDSAFLDDRPVDCAVDASGNFIIAGWTEQGTWATNQDDYMLLKYDSNGILIWRTRYDRSGFKDQAAAMAVDNLGDVFVTGRSSNGSDDDFVTMKLNGADGSASWVKIYSGGNGDDRATAIALDNAGNPVVTGRYDNGTNDDFRTIKYSSAGNILWTRASFGCCGNDRPFAIAIDQSTNDVYVTGESDVDLTTLTDYDILTFKYNASGVPQWNKTWAGGALNEDVPSDIAVDAFGNIIICGKTDGDPDPNHSNFDWVTLKYDASGTPQYSKTKNGSRNDDDEATSLVIDAPGNAIVAGYINNTTTQKDASRIEYDAIGNPALEKHYNGEGDFNESAHAMVQDGSGNTYIAGYAYTESDNKNIFAAKIDPSGNLVDTFLFNGTNDDDDELAAIAYDGTGNLYACGYTKTDGEKSNFILIKFNMNMDSAWTRTYNFISQSDKAVSLVVDNTGIYVTGVSDADANDTTANDDIVTMKFDAGGNVIWTTRYNDIFNFRDEPVKIILGQNNRVYVTGRNTNSHDDDIVLLAYDRTTGVDIPPFPKSWNSNFLDDDRAADIIEDASGNIYICGYSQSGSFVEDYTVLKYDAAGSLQWSVGYDGTAGQEDQATSIALDASGNVVVTGKTDVDNTSTVTNYNYGTFIYDPSGNYICPDSLPFTYNGAGNGDDVPVTVHVNGNDILVTGQSAEGINTARNKNIMVRFISEGACSRLAEYAEYDGPAHGGDAPNASIVASSSIFVTGSSDGADNQKDIITLKFDITTGVNDASAVQATASVYPNPMTSTAVVSVQGELAGRNDLHLSVYNVLGELVYEKPNMGSQVTLDKKDFTEGVYSFRVLADGHTVATGRFIAD